MNDWLLRLEPKARRGSKPRCHWLTHGNADAVAARLTAMVSPHATVRPTDCWMPAGFAQLEEAELDKAERLIGPAERLALQEWWLAVSSPGARTPNFDIASTCEIDGKPGLLLVEAKAHDAELVNEGAGRSLSHDSSDARRRNHAQIGTAIAAAAESLTTATGLPWNISRDHHYQMSNRFAWACKLAELGIPVVLVYLGFLHADEMIDRGQPFDTDATWAALVRQQSADLFPPDIWNRKWDLNGQAFVPLIRSLEISLEDGV